ncbi:ATP-dependent DNA helicase PIF1 [Brachionus plicatilis]|uniref:ATP-dependent DNA helicase PIF1 n=1 Tax=Brachionus plicatilis TaxID=10195 RepID=A0A3M7SGS5_BRAPC|nr:ATP-dependent DNA helicase PIF1 [Brachionus plicatilis]
MSFNEKANTPETQSNEKMTEDELKVYFNHIKAYTDAVNDVFELNKMTAQINNSVNLLLRKKLAVEQRLKAIKNFGSKKYGSKVYYPDVIFSTLNFNQEVFEINSSQCSLSLSSSQTSSTPSEKSTKRKFTNLDDDEDLLNNINPIESIKKQCKHCGLFGHVQTRNINCLKNRNRLRKNSLLSTEPSTLNFDHPQPSTSITSVLTSTINNFDSPSRSKNIKNTESPAYNRTPEQVLWNNIQTKLDKEKYIKEFDSSKNGPLHEQDWVQNEFDKYYQNIDELKQFYCTNCHELWPTKTNYCQQCKDDKIKYSKENDMVPGIDDLPDEIKIHFEELTMIEEMVISPILPIMSVYRLSGGALAS